VASIMADPLEQYVHGIVLPLADSPELRDAIRSEDEDSANQASEAGSRSVSSPSP